MAGNSKILSTAVVRWQHAGDARITVVVKATFALSPKGIASLGDAEAIVDDVHHDRNEGRSLALASDRAPRKSRAEVVFFGSAYAPPNERVAHRRVRVALESAAGKTLLDKSLLVVGTRRFDPHARAFGAPEPFTRIPLQWELAFGGATIAENPVGVGSEAYDTRAPNVVNEAGERIAAGFAPIDPRWPSRARKLRHTAIAGAVPVLSGDFDFSFFDVAPDDQRVREILGDETLVLVGLHPTAQEVRCTLPGVRPSASIAVGEKPIDVPLVCDTMSIHGDALTVSLVWRGDIATPAQLGDGEVEVTARLRAFTSRSSSSGPKSKHVSPKFLKQTQRAVVHPPPEAPPPRSMRSVFGTTTGDAISADTPRAPGPFAFVAVPPPPRIDVVEPRAPSADDRAPSPPTEDMPPSTMIFPETIVFPSVPTKSEPKAEEDERDGNFDPPPRRGDLVPIVDTSPYVTASFATQLEPPQDLLVVVVKATFDLGESAVSLSDDQMLPSGDVHHDDDPKASLRYASDFVPFKPRADVLLVGSVPSGAEGNVAFVTLSVAKLERRLAVFGDRTWRRLGGATDPAPFVRMPLRWERALGGPLSKDNPVGVGHGTATLAPNLEDPERLLDRADKVVAPTCFGPISRDWKQRASQLGTYDKTWLRTRWPYFPEDFNPSYFNAAPKPQQIAFLEGGERFKITGVAAHALQGRVPKERPRVFAQRTKEAGGELVELRMRLDTLWFDVDARKLVVVWRGFVGVEDDDAPDVSLVFVAMDDDAKKPMELEQARRRLHAALVARELVKPDAPVDVTAANDEKAVSLRTAYARVRASKSPPAAPAPEKEAADALPSAPPVDATALLDAVRERESIAGMDFTGVDLCDRDLSGADLSGAILARAKLSRTKLDGANLQGTVLAGATGDSVSLDGANLSRADLSGVELHHADFSKATLDDAVLERAQLISCTFVDASAERATFVGARLVGANFQGAKLARAELASAELEEASFADADLTDVRLYDADARGARFSRAKMRGARADGVTLVRAVLTEVDAPKSVWDRADLSDANLDSAKLAGSTFVRTNLERSIFSRADVRDGCFRRAKMRRAKMQEANLAGAIFERAVLDEADLRGANLYGAETWKASLSSVRTELAFVAGTKLA